ncbi:hypothetical protein OY671_009102, partial [Metschnikowia pulcherrima]
MMSGVRDAATVLGRQDATRYGPITSRTVSLGGALTTMKIDIISSDGIHASEKEASERMRQAFNASDFSQKWHGYAGFMMMDTTYRDREIDLVLSTHDR